MYFFEIVLDIFIVIIYILQLMKCMIIIRSKLRIKVQILEHVRYPVKREQQKNCKTRTARTVSSSRGLPSRTRIVIAILNALTVDLNGSSGLTNHSGRDRRREKSDPPSGPPMIL